MLRKNKNQINGKSNCLGVKFMKLSQTWENPIIAGNDLVTITDKISTNNKNCACI